MSILKVIDARCDESDDYCCPALVRKYIGTAWNPQPRFHPPSSARAAPRWRAMMSRWYQAATSRFLWRNPLFWRSCANYGENLFRWQQGTGVLHRWWYQLGTKISIKSKSLPAKRLTDRSPVCPFVRPSVRCRHQFGPLFGPEMCNIALKYPIERKKGWKKRCPPRY